MSSYGVCKKGMMMGKEDGDGDRLKGIWLGGGHAIAMSQ